MSKTIAKGKAKMPPKDECGHPTKKGTPCTNPRKKGEVLCASHLKLTARPSKITEATPLIVQALEVGNTREGACAYAGIGQSTFYSWLERAEADIEQDAESQHRELLEAVTRAEGIAQQSLVTEIRKSATGFVNPDTRKREGKDWRAAAWMLERRHPDQWSEQKNVKHSGSLRTEPVDIPNDAERVAEVGDILAGIGVIGGE